MAVIDNLVAYYSLDESSGNAVDAFGSKTLTETGTVGAATGKVSGARDFENSGTNYFSRSDSAFSFPSGSFTIAAWVKPETLTSMSASYGGGVAAYMTADQQGDWWVSIDGDGRIIFAHFAITGSNASGRHYSATATAADATWLYVVARLSSGTYTIWANGVSVSTTDGGTATGWANIGFNVGREYSAGVYQFDGLIDELGIWNAAKSDADIAWLYNSGSGRSYADIVAEAGGGSVIVDPFGAAGLFGN